MEGKSVRRQTVENMMRRALYSAAPEMTGYVADEILKAPRFKAWADGLERSRPRGLIAIWRRIFGRRDDGLTEAEQDALNRLVKEALDQRRSR